MAIDALTSLSNENYDIIEIYKYILFLSAAGLQNNTWPF